MQQKRGDIQRKASKRLQLFKWLKSVQCYLCLSLISSLSMAHEFWIEPQQYQLAERQLLQAELKVGQHYLGESQPFFDFQFERFSIYCGDQAQPVKSRFGAIPALSQKLPCAGLNRVVYVSRPSFVVYQSAEQFQQFLQYEGLMPILAVHQQRGLPANGFKEAYRRFSKALVWQQGDGAVVTQDEPIGLAFEWVAEQSPYSETTTLRFSLLLAGQPSSDVQARLFYRDPNGQVTETVYRTDQHGQLMLSNLPAGEYMLNAVHMRPMSAQLAKATGAVWESLWAATSFAISPAQTESKN